MRRLGYFADIENLEGKEPGKESRLGGRGALSLEGGARETRAGGHSCRDFKSVFVERAKIRKKIKKDGTAR